ncbi:hypothetical protein NEF87_004095 [Candidatus Lokiarchaeum ossiferum]|uniref:Periplasmic copper-binding protein NosD beta helix domain-containing protein n=1 Tax=Candidatus Lokiarchaeum ossiferum TaxID=2951803 RepID=A0ABY6HWM0_9ARCH|nr:hypothetical protein NEF87_004095 [Candidatus Lokiarchaeum sp. B-35]
MILGIGIIIGIGSIVTYLVIDSSNNANFRMKMHDPIQILSDDDFRSVKRAGSGSENDPYIISNYQIDASGEHEPAIAVENTQKHFIIINCSISTNYVAIRFKNVVAGTAKIIGNNCTSKNNDGAGINLILSDSCEIKNNTCSFFFQGIHLNTAKNNLIQNNLIKNSSGDGINLRTSSSNVIMQNMIESNANYGLSFVLSSRNNLAYCNRFLNNGLSFAALDQNHGYDENASNLWYNTDSEQGNFWSNYDGSGNYVIEGSVSNEDIFPLTD